MIQLQNILLLFWPEKKIRTHLLIQNTARYQFLYSIKR